MGEEVRTLNTDDIRREVARGGLRRDASICRVGDTSWKTLAEAGELGVGPLPDLESVTDVDDSDLFVEGPEPRIAPSPPRTWRNKLPVVKKATIVMWAIAGVVGLMVVLQRNGVLHSVATSLGQGEQYEALETDLVGGPGAGTVRSAKALWQRTVPAADVPFSEVATRTPGTADAKK